MNLPLGGHRILVVGLGRLDRHGRMHRWQICCYPMQLSFCCGRNEDL
jgi:hypothetical protein